LIIVAGTLISLIVCKKFNLAALFGGFTFIGFLDDFIVPRTMPGKRGLGWKQKLGLQFLFAAGFGAIQGLGPTQIAVTVFVLLFFSNAYNFSDGLDALAGSILIFLTLGIASIGLMFGQTEPVVVAVALLGGVIPFLFLNAPPAKVFMGDTGSLPIGALIGASVLQLGRIEDHTGPMVYLALTALSIMMIVELVPVPLQILSVKLRKKKLFPFTPIHHAFEKAGWPESRVVWRFALVQLLCTAVAISLAAYSFQSP